MSTHNNYKIISKVLACAIVSTLLTVNTYAATATEKPKTTKQETKKELIVQDFKHKSLDVQFRYINQKLVGIRFLNTGELPLKLYVLHDHYVLGPKDSVILNPPSIELLRIRYHVVVGEETTVAHILKNRFGREEIYTLPISADIQVTKSDQKTPTE